MGKLIVSLIGLIFSLFVLGLFVAIAMWAFANLSTLFFILLALVAVAFIYAFVVCAFKALLSIRTASPTKASPVKMLSDKLINSGQLDPKSVYSIAGNIFLVASIVLLIASIVTRNINIAGLSFASIVAAHLSFERDSFNKTTK